MKDNEDNRYISISKAIFGENEEWRKENGFSNDSSCLINFNKVINHIQSHPKIKTIL
jgi:hypothetical protein